jgi:mediator of RNA polymerase II transcription subunit 16
MINALAGSVRWVLELVAWITDTLLTLPSTLPETMDLKDPSSISLPDLLTHLKQANNISLHLLLSSPTRGFLTAICRRLAHIDYIARKAITMTPQAQNGLSNQPQPVQNLSPALKAAYLQIAILTDSTILRIKTFETLLSSLSSHIKTAYASHTPSLSGSQQAEKTRNAIEIKMMLGGSIPDAFRSVIAELFRPEGLLDSVREEIDPSKLFFADFSLLEVDEDPVSVGKRKRAGMTMDCFRKSWLPNPNKKDRLPPGMPILPENAMVPGGLAGGGRQGARWKRCARCTAVMEDVLTQKPALQWLVMQQRRCFCGGYWDTLGPGETMA